MRKKEENEVNLKIRSFKNEDTEWKGSSITHTHTHTHTPVS